MINLNEFGNAYLEGLKRVLDTFDLEGFERIVDLILEAYHSEKRIFVMGNGGSGSTASHFACDINKGCCIDLNKKFKMLCLNDNLPTLLALSNDIGYPVIFEEQLKNFYQPGDLVIGISGSGNSENVLRAVDYAKKNGGKTIGLSGYSGGRLSEMVDVPFVARVEDMQKVEDIHMVIVHMIMQAVFFALHPEASKVC